MEGGGGRDGERGTWEGGEGEAGGGGRGVGWKWGGDKHEKPYYFSLIVQEEINGFSNTSIPFRPLTGKTL